MEVPRLLALAVLAGAFIALGAMFATTVLAGADGVVPVRDEPAAVRPGVLPRARFSCVVGGAELFTGNTLMVMAWAAGKVRLREMLRAWAIVYVGNFIGAVGTARWCSSPDNISSAKAAWRPSRSRSRSTRSRCRSTTRCSSAFCATCWCAWRSGLRFGARTTTDKVLAVLFPVSAFVVAGFEHSVANMYLIPLGLFIKAWAPAALWTRSTAPPPATTR